MSREVNRGAFKRGVCDKCLDAVVDFGGVRSASESTFALPEDVVGKQRDGTVALYNILREHNVALLADEVGMGKTYQALGVISLLFAQNPGARVLVIAPNESVQNGWRRSYSDFIGTKVRGDWLKDPLLGEATHPLHYCKDVLAFADHYLDNPRGLFLTRVSSFSSLRTSVSRGSHKLKDLDPDEGPTPRDIFKHWKRWDVFLDETSVLDSEVIARQLDLCGVGGADEMTADSPLRSSRAINVECARQFASLLEPFDLVVIDESHNIRKRGSNIKTNVLSTLLGLRPPGLDDARQEELEPATQEMPRLLLLTATPAYYSERDIYNQFAYRDRDALGGLKGQLRRDEARRWVEARTVRRLRRLSDKTKYEYREERAFRTLEDDPTVNREALVQELMLALVQKRLAEHFTERHDLTATIKVGYLETFESFENPDDAKRYLEEGEGTHDDIEDGSQEADDADILRKIAARYQDACGGLPPHPKLTHIERSFTELLQQSVPEKMLVFVRRRASVREVSRRLCNAYDEVTLKQLRSAYETAADLVDVNAFQRHVHLALAKDDDRVDELVELSGQKSDDLLAFSRLLSPFKSSVKDNEGRLVSAGGFGLRQRFNKGNTLEHFFDENRVRLLHDLLRGEVGTPDDFQEFVRRYVPGASLSFLEHTLGASGNSNVDERALVDVLVLDALANARGGPPLMAHLAEELRDQLILLHGDQKVFAQSLTLGRMAANAFAGGSTPKADALLYERHFWDLARGSAQKLKASFKETTQVQRELADTLLPKQLDHELGGLLKRRATWMEMVSKQLRMSEPIIDIFFAFVEAKGDTADIDRDRMASSLAMRLFEHPHVRFARLRYRMVESGRLFAHLVKHLEVDEADWLGNRWTKFDNQEPALGVMGGTGSRERAIAQFNAPFCPDVVISTSVLREGVDLHLSCRRVWHYGLPASPGSLEQQTGRVDRYFARVHRGLEHRKGHVASDTWPSYRPRERAPGSEETLEVGFPFVPRSIDEMQLKRLLHRKGRVQPIMDRGLSVTDTREEVELDRWDEREPDDIIAAFQDFSAENGDPFSAADKAMRSHRGGCGLRSRDNVADDARRSLEQLLDQLSEAVEGSPLEVSWRSATLQGINASDPLMLLNTYIKRDGSQLHLSSEQKSGARHQPTLVHLRFVPNVGLYVLEFDTPLEEGTGNERGLRTRLMQDYPAAGCSIVTSEHRATIGTWTTRLLSAVPLSFENGKSEEIFESDRIIGRLQTLMSVADELERSILEGDIKVDDVRQTLRKSYATEGA